MKRTLFSELERPAELPLMLQFQNILVGVDITRLESSDTAKFTGPVEEAIRTGLWLARKSGARLTFLSVLDGSEQPIEVLSDDDRQQVVNSVRALAIKTLDLLIERAKAVQVRARSVVRMGKGWVEIIRQVAVDDHDLVIVGTRDLGTVRRLLLGSTAMKLLRKCPCAVWVTKPTSVAQVTLNEIVVASDFSSTAERALQAAVGLARQTGAHIQLVHAVDFPLDRIWTTGLPDKVMDEYHQRVRLRSLDQLQRQANIADTDAADGVLIEPHIVEGGLHTDVAVLKFIEERTSDLLVIGTIARRGIAGVFVGNTAERLLPQLTCSVLAVKPADFVSPIDTDANSPAGKEP